MTRGRGHSALRRLASVPLLALLASGAAWGGCDEGQEAPEARAASQGAQAVEVDPPFAVRGNCEGLLLAWFDANGVHVVDRRSDVPEARREHVRVDSLDLAPADRLDPDEVFVADLRQPRDDGRYRVVRMSRQAFDAMVDAAQGAAAPAAAAGGAGDEVVLYGASWCSACRAAAKYLRERGVPFVEKDIEKDQAAALELMRKAQAAGAVPGSIPVIDVRGTLVEGFNPATLDQLLSGGPKPI
jgi:glutaredoxin